LLGGFGVIRAAHFEANEPLLSKAGRPVHVGFRMSQLSGVGTLLVGFDTREAQAESRLSELLEAAPDAIVKSTAPGASF
jgi:hypothetical protein